MSQGGRDLNAPPRALLELTKSEFMRVPVVPYEIKMMLTRECTFLFNYVF